MFLRYKLDNTLKGLAGETPEKLLWDKVETNGVVNITGSDEENRVKFVNFQATVEATLTSLLKQNRIASVVGVIHTPLPPTPLRKEEDKTENVVAGGIAKDPKRLATIEKRENILRDYLQAGGRLLSVYPKSVLEQAVPGIEIYKKLQASYQNLVDKPVTMAEFPAEFTGATYLVKDKLGLVTFFSLQAYQANKAEDGKQWGVWFGSLEKQPVMERFEKIDGFLKNHEIDLLDELKASKFLIKEKHNNQHIKANVLAA